MIKHFDHATIVVRDLAKATTFFELLGFSQEISVVIAGEKFARYMGVAGIEAQLAFGCLVQTVIALNEPSGLRPGLVLRLAALYGEEMDSTDAMKHARELLITIAGGAGMRFLAEQAAKAVPFGGDFIAGAIAGAATYSIGQVALEYYDGGKRISPSRLRNLYSTFYQRFRNQRSAQDWKRYALNGVDAPLEIDMPRSTNDTTTEKEQER